MTAQHDLNRRLRFTGTKFTLMSASDAKKDFNLCGICSLKDACMMKARVDKIMDEFGISAPVAECPQYRPRLVFRAPMIGLDGTFNTIRIGAAWADRLQPGVVVSLTNSVDESEIGLARVIASFAKPYSEIQGKHARFNHTQLDKLPSAAPDLLFKVLTRCYGTTYMTRDRIVSVIYLERLDEAQTDAA